MCVITDDDQAMTADAEVSIDQIAVFTQDLQTGAYSESKTFRLQGLIKTPIPA